MIITFEEWANECGGRLGKISREIEIFCNAARTVRTSAVKFDQSNLGRTTSDLSELLTKLKTNIETAKTCLAGRLLNGSLTESDSIDAKLNEVVQRISDIKGVVDSRPIDNVEAVSSKLRRKPPLLQRGAKYFASVAGIFQLKDCFDQRVEHITTSIRLALSRGECSQQFMLQFINVQVAGLATMTADFSKQAYEATEMLEKLHRTAVLEKINSDQIEDSCAAFIAENIVVPIKYLVQNFRSSFLESGPNHAALDTSVTEGSKLIISTSKDSGRDEISSILNKLEECIKNICDHHPRVAELTGADIPGEISLSYVDLRGRIESLGESADSLTTFCSDAIVAGEECIDRSPDADDLLASLVNSFTMDAEREDHNSVMRRLGMIR